MSESTQIRLLGEDTLVRGENQKQFRRRDGMRERILYDHPVHFLKGEKWEPIDNTLIKDEKEQSYRNTDSALLALLPLAVKEESRIRVTYREKTLSWEIEGVEKSEGSVMEQEEEKDHDLALILPKELCGSIRYSGAISGADLVYELDSLLLREKIILHEEQEARENYRYTLYWEGEARETEKELLFLSDGETVFKLHRPGFQDSKGAYIAPETRLEKKEPGVWTYTVFTPADWLKEAERGYPVTLDPSVAVPFKDFIEDYHISAYGSVNDRDSLMVGSGSKFRTIIKPDLSGVTFPENCFIQEADIVLSRYVYSGTNDGDNINIPVQLYLLTSAWPSTQSGLAALYTAIDTTQADSQAKAGALNILSSWDITEIGRKWVAGQETNKGILLKSWNDSDYVYFRSSEYSTAYNSHPYFSFVFADANGKDDRWHYYTQATSRAGTGLVNTYSGSLHLDRTDAVIANGAMPVNVTLSYNSADRAADIGYGKGWSMSYAWKLQEKKFSDAVYGTETRYLCITDGFGTDRYYLLSGSTWVSELDHETQITVSGSTATLADKKGNKLLFAFATENSLMYGRLTTVRDANGNETQITYGSTDLHSLRVTQITEALKDQAAANRQSLTLTYTGSRLSSVTVPNGLNVTYTYDSSGYLTAVTYADGNQAAYTYSSGYLASVSDPDGFGYAYTWGSGTNAEHVTGILEKKGETSGRSLAFTYTRNTTKVTDGWDRNTVYQFDNYGQARSIRDSEGNAVYTEYNTGDRKVTELTGVSKTQKSVVNLLLNHGFENGSTVQWTVSSGTNVSAVTTQAHTGKYSLQIKNANSNATQAVTVQAGKRYTLSAYFYGAGGRVQVLNGTTVIAESAVSATASGWERVFATFTVPSGVTSLKAKLVMTVSGTVYCDGVQFELGDSPSRYNMVNNGSFLHATAGFTSRSEYCTTSDKVIDISGTAVADTHPTELGNQVFHLIGSPRREKTVDQLIDVKNGLAGDTYSFGGWLKSNGTPKKGLHDNTPSYYYNGIKELEVTLLAGSFSKGTKAITFGADTSDWQYGCASVTATAAYTRIRIRMTFSCVTNDAYFDGIQLYKEQFEKGYAYDSDGNVTGSSSLIGQNRSFVYNSSNDVTSYTDPLSHTTSFTYDTKHNLLTATSPLGVVTTNTYNSKGQVTETTVGSSTVYIRSSSEYSAVHGLKTSAVDARGNSVTYGYDNATRLNTTVTDPKGNTSTYTYGNAANMRRLASLQGAGTGTVSYGYDTYGKLTSVTRGSTVYNLTYNTWSYPSATEVGSTTLSTNNYDGHHRLSKITYGNGYSVQYVYDNMDRVNQIKIRETESGSYTPAYENIYDKEGNLYEQRNYRTLKAVFFEYDHAGRCLKATEKSFTGSGSSISYGSVTASYGYTFNAGNLLTNLAYTAAGSSWNTGYGYDNDNRPLTATFASGKILTNTYDAAGRITKRRLGLASNYDTNLTYVAGANSSKTALLATYQNGSDTAFSYTYDANGNITSVTQGSTSVTYTYDSANQVTRENNGFTNQTVTYTYDSWGNLTQKKIYAYTTATDPGTATSTISYTYGNSTWGDQLTAYNGQTIVYDVMGNPTTYLGKTLTWEGKRLKTVGTTSYDYDQNGLRTKKTVGSTVTEYTWSGSLLAALSQGSNKLLFSYDQSGRVCAVSFNGTYYYYVRNGQGDIIKLIDNSGAEKVVYTYDTWGRKLTCTGTLASTLGKLNPFRYRGYVYDEETQWYYLRSRYYDPATCRFLSADVMLSTGQGVLGHNCYAYCLNNPINAADLFGKFPEWIIAVIIIALTIALNSGCDNKQEEEKEDIRERDNTFDKTYQYIVIAWAGGYKSQGPDDPFVFPRNTRLPKGIHINYKYVIEEDQTSTFIAQWGVRGFTDRLTDFALEKYRSEGVVKNNWPDYSEEDKNRLYEQVFVDFERHYYDEMYEGEKNYISYPVIQ